MAFETNRLVDGQWTTHTLDVNTVLKHYDKQDREANIRDLDIEKAPALGLLTQTVVRSPLVHWILPAKLRNPERNDVAFIGDEFVQIKELRPDRQLWDVIRKENFGARIRNACVLGSIEAFRKEDIASTQIKEEDDIMDLDESMHNASHQQSLSPQFIVLQLDTGDSVFLMLRQSKSGELEFVSSRHRVTKSMLKLQPGIHLTVDPGSRYMAVGCSEHLFAIYALHPREELSKQYQGSSTLRHVQSESYFNVQGIILKMEFLYPTADDESHIILLVLVVSRGKTRMVLYEWETGQDLAKLRARSPKGHPLDASQRMPLLIVPLTIKSCFILIYETFMTVCQGLLEGSPTFQDFNPIMDPPTQYYHGKGIPLWTSWTRPIRRESFRTTRDDIYVVREDGVIKFLELDSKLEEIVQADMKIGELAGNCGTALASLDYHTYGSQSGDMLITGGDSCSGGTYLIQARKVPFFIEPIHNWSPAPDFVTTHLAEDETPADEYELNRRKRNPVPRPDRIFACAGKGAKGVITEFRYGLEAKIGLEMDYQMPIMEAWVLCPSFDSLDDDDDDSLFLLSLGDRSAVLRLSADAQSVGDLGEHETKFDLRFRTIAASMHRSFTIQVTEQSIVLMNGPQVHIHDRAEILDVQEDGNLAGHGLAIDKTIIHEDTVLFTTRLNNSVYLQILEQRDADDMETDGVSTIEPRTNVRTLGKYSSNVTALAISPVEHSLCAIVAEVRDHSIILVFEGMAEKFRREIKIPLKYENGVNLEAFVSIAIAYKTPGTLTLLCGTRNGLLVTLDVDETTLEIATSRCDRLGMSQVMVKRDVQPHSGEMFYATCDSKIFVLSPDRSPSAHSSQAWAINQVWLTDALKPDLQQPDITSLARLRPNLSGGSDGGLLLVVGSQLLLAAFSTQAKSVPRHIPVGGTPTRLLYSHDMDLLIVGAIVDKKTVLLFIDPNTGENLSAPSEQKTKAPIDYISGLGKTGGEKIYHLLEWSFTKNHKTWSFIIVATSSGRLLVVSVQPESRRQSEVVTLNGTEAELRGRKIQFWTKYMFKRPDPIYSVTGFSDGLLWCSGTKLLCETLDLKEKKFKRVAEYELPSPATTISYDNGLIYALTNCHSLEILQLTLDGEGGGNINRTHGDQITRDTLHHVYIHRAVGRPIHLISDKHCSVVGLWATQDTKADTLETVFEAELPHSILKFRPGRCRPAWDPCWTPSGTDSRPSPTAKVTGLKIIPKSANRSELLGLSIDGSLSQFTTLDITEWKFLRFLINLAIRSPKVCEFTYKDDSVPLEPLATPKLMMHVDGDILKRCLMQKSLAKLLRLGQNTEESAQIFTKFYELLQELHGGALEEHADSSLYMEQAYADLRFYLRPVL